MIRPLRCLDHPLHRAAGAAEGAGEVGVDDGVEVLVAHPHEQAVAGDAGVGDEHLDRAAEDLLGLGEGLVDRGRCRSPRSARPCRPSGGSPRAVRDDDVVARLDQGRGDGSDRSRGCRR